jgi:hypothetical protein
VGFNLVEDVYVWGVLVVVTTITGVVLEVILSTYIVLTMDYKLPCAINQRYQQNLCRMMILV